MLHNCCIDPVRRTSKWKRGNTLRDYYGWRARIGLIYPSESLVMDTEFYAMAPEGVGVYTNRVDLLDASYEGLAALVADDRIEVATAMFKRAPLDVVTFGGTSASFLHGADYDQKLIMRMEAALPGVPASTTSTAGVKALRALGVQKPCFVGPYVDEVTDRGREFFNANGFDVTSAHGLGITDNLELDALPLEQIYEFVKNSVDDSADGVFISCTGIRTIGAIAALEVDLGRPVVSAIQATFWDALRVAGVGGGKADFGSLFEY